ncbi:energy transducer TonB [Psychrobacter sp. PAMC 21119]|uniref:energy transducer TonB n=1 Tax=Psychrobacter sp. PAMC 21119 TaxID=1112209 RepID=UPI00028A0F1F|nr:energy transducer TonB [Psychrobacter sp. PAMC 21119]
MIRKRNTKFALNHIASNKTASHFLTNIKSIGAYGLLTTLFALLTITASITPAQAELVDLSNPEPVIQLSTQDASWRRPPKFENIPAYLNKYLTHCSYDQDGNIIRPCDRRDLKMFFSLRVDKQGSIRNVKVIESSGIKKIDDAFSRELKKARFKPFLRKGRAVEGNIDIPIVFTAS